MRFADSLAWQREKVFMYPVVMLLSGYNGEKGLETNHAPLISQSVLGGKPAEIIYMHWQTQLSIGNVNILTAHEDNC
ncbi:hypothetical protein BS78_10G126500 [Paspalum vaginatum]|nr:hypothetical protein BS78_10G126500 [Paspalum vaginatum]